MITRCSRYNSRPGVAARPFTCVCTRWMVNVEPRVSLAWPPRRPDHNAWSSFSQADHDHGDPTFFVCSFAPSPSPLPPPRSSTLLGIARTGPFPLEERACSFLPSRRWFFVTDRYALPLTLFRAVYHVECRRMLHMCVYVISYGRIESSSLSEILVSRSAICFSLHILIP